MGFVKLENNRPFLKMAFQGFAGDGKTFTASEVAIGLHKLLGSKKPIALFDTERAFKALVPHFKANGVQAEVDESRSLADLTKDIKLCEDGFADILIVDSLTHVYEDYLQAYMTQKKRTRLEFQDWGILKPKWKKEFSTAYVMAKCHIIFNGRAGYEYGDEINEQTGKREIYKSGIKMKAENETAFEPDILVMMEKVQDILEDKKKIYRIATVLKDRSNLIDGKTFNQDGKKKGPDYKDFEPAIKSLLNGISKDSAIAETPVTFQEEEKKTWDKQNRDRAISEIEGAFNFMGLGTAVEHKKLKTAILKKVFDVLSLDSLSSMNASIVEKGSKSIKIFADKYIPYMVDCDGTPDMKYISEMLAESIASTEPVDELNKALNGQN